MGEGSLCLEIPLDPMLLEGIHETLKDKVTAANAKGVEEHLIPRITYVTIAIIRDLAHSDRGKTYQKRVAAVNRSDIRAMKKKIAQRKRAKKVKN